MMENRPSGKTTRLFEDAVNLAATLPESHKIYITGAHTRWLEQLKRDFKGEGLVGVEVMTIPQILNGGLRGRKGVLLIDDIRDITSMDLSTLLDEKRYLEIRSGQPRR
jgi:hypothetical protein